MRNSLNKLNIRGTIVIGEGEIDQAPMLYIGEQVGTGQGPAIDIAVDPIDGTRMTAMRQSGALSVLAASNAGCFLQAPDMYMEKLVVNSAARGVIDLNQPLLHNLQQIAERLNKPLSSLRVALLAKPRHEKIIATLRQTGIRVMAFPDGDVATSILVGMQQMADVMYGIGGAPEGIISAAAIQAVGGDMQARLLPRHQVQADTAQNRQLAAQELQRCQEMGIKTH